MKIASSLLQKTWKTLKKYKKERKFMNQHIYS